MSDLHANQAVADHICRHFEWQGSTFQPGQCVALLKGEVVAVAESLDDALAALRAIEPDPAKGMVLEVAVPVTDVVRGVCGGRGCR